MPSIVADNIVATVDWQEKDLYRFFALMFAPPTPDCFAFLAQPVASRIFHDLWSLLRCEGEFPGFEWFASFELYESTYIALFDVGIPEPPVPLFESAHDKTRPAQEIALENTYFYGVLGLQSDPSRAVPDYLVTQLEFLAAVRYTGEHASDQATAISLAHAETEFLERHLLNWVPTARAKLSRIDVSGFRVLMTLLEQFLRNRLCELKRPTEG